MARKEAQSEQMDPSTPTWYILCSKSLDQTKITSCNIAALTFTPVRPFCPNAARDSNCFSDIPLFGWLQTSPGLDKKIPSSPARPQPPRIGLTMFHESHLGLLPTSLPWQWRCQSLTESNSIFRDRRLAGVHQSQLWARRCPERNCARVPLLCLALPHQHLHPSSEQGRATMP